jgi:hypothetical protein
MKSITNIEKTTLPAIRRTDEVVAKRDEARREIAVALDGLSRAEIGVVARIGMSGTSLLGVEDSEYRDGYLVEEGRFSMTTRRLSEKALRKALRSLLSKGIIRIEGGAPRKPDRYRRRSSAGDLVGRRYQHGEVGNSGIGIDSDGEVYENSSVSGTVTSQQFAVWYVRALFDEEIRSPEMWVGGYMTAAVRVYLDESLASAFRREDVADSLVYSARQLAWDVERVESVEVAEIIKPEPNDLFNAVSRAYSDARNAGEDVGKIYDAMRSALDEFASAAMYGESPENSITPEEYVASIARLSEKIEKTNAKIEEVIA